MDNIYQRNRFRNYNNYNNIGNIDLYQIDNINESPSGDNYIKDIMLSEAKKKRQKKIIKSQDFNINNFFNFNKKDNFINNTDKKSNNNNSFRKIIEKYSNLNNELYKNVMDNNYKINNKKQNDKINTEAMNKFKIQNINSPYRYKKQYPINNEININRNKEQLRNENQILNKNKNFINNRNNHMFDYYIYKKQTQNHNPNPMVRKDRYNNQPMNL